MTKRLLLVEDDRLSRESLATLLRGMGHEVRACWSAEDASIMIHDYVPDVALLDIRLPGISGDKFAEHLHEQCPATRIIFVTGEFHFETSERMGANVTCLPKPIDFPRLLHSIQN